MPKTGSNQQTGQTPATRAQDLEEAAGRVSGQQAIQLLVDAADLRRDDCGEPEAALALLQKARLLQPQSKRVLDRLTSLLAAMERWSEYSDALAAASAAVDDREEQAQWLARRGDVLRTKLSRLVEARANYRDVVRLTRDPELRRAAMTAAAKLDRVLDADRPPSRTAGSVPRSGQRMRPAMPVRVRSLTGATSAKYRAAQNALASGELERARQLIDAVLLVAPANVDARRLQYQLDGRTDQEHRFIDRVLADTQDVSSDLALPILRACTAVRPKSAASLALYEQILRRDSRDDQALSEAIDLLLEARRPEGVAELLPDLPALERAHRLEALASGAEVVGDPEATARFRAVAFDDDPANGRAFEARRTYHEKLNDLDGLENALEMRIVACSSSKERVRLNERLAEIRIQLGRPSDAAQGLLQSMDDVEVTSLPDRVAQIRSYAHTARASSLIAHAYESASERAGIDNANRRRWLEALARLRRDRLNDIDGAIVAFGKAVEAGAACRDELEALNSGFAVAAEVTITPDAVPAPQPALPPGAIDLQDWDGGEEFRTEQLRGIDMGALLGDPPPDVVDRWADRITQIGEATVDSGAAVRALTDAFEQEVAPLDIEDFQEQLHTRLGSNHHAQRLAEDFVDHLKSRSRRQTPRPSATPTLAAEAPKPPVGAVPSQPLDDSTELARRDEAFGPGAALTVTEDSVARGFQPNASPTLLELDQTLMDYVPHEPVHSDPEPIILADGPHERQAPVEAQGDDALAFAPSASIEAVTYQTWARTAAALALDGQAEDANIATQRALECDDLEDIRDVLEVLIAARITAGQCTDAAHLVVRLGLDDIRPLTSDRCEYIASLYLDGGSPWLAEQWFDAALVQDPRALNAARPLLSLLVERGAARAIADLADRVDPGPDAVDWLLALADAQEALLEPKQAQATLERAYAYATQDLRPAARLLAIHLNRDPARALDAASALRSRALLAGALPLALRMATLEAHLGGHSPAYEPLLGSQPVESAGTMLATLDTWLRRIPIPRGATTSSRAPKDISVGIDLDEVLKGLYARFSLPEPDGRPHQVTQQISQALDLHAERAGHIANQGTRLFAVLIRPKLASCLLSHEPEAALATLDRFTALVCRDPLSVLEEMKEDPDRITNLVTSWLDEAELLHEE